MVPEFPQHDLDARQGEEAFVGFEQPIVSDQDTALETQPGVRSLNDVAQPVAMRARVFSEGGSTPARSSIMPLRNDRRDSALPQRGAERAAVVGAVRQEPARASSATPSTPAADRDISQHAVCELQFMDVGSLKREGDGCSVSVDED